MSKGNSLIANLTYEYMLPPSGVNEFLRIIDNDFAVHLGYHFKSR